MRKTITALATAGVLAVAGGVAAAEIGGVGPFASSSSAELESTNVVAVDVMPSEHTFAVVDAGSVTVIAAESSLEVAGVEAAAGWTAEVEVATGREVEVKFDQPGSEVDFNAELEDGRLEIRVRERSDAGMRTTTTTIALGSESNDDTSIALEVSGSAAVMEIGETRTFDVDGAGTVTVELTADGLMVVSVAAADGWVSEIEMQSGSEVEVDFRSGATRTKFEAELEDGGIKVDIETETRSDGIDDSDDDDSDDDDSGDDDSDDELTFDLIDDGATATFSAGAAGSVTLQRNGNNLEVVSVDALPGWTFNVDAGGDGEVEIDFMSLTGSIEFSAEVEDGRIEIDVDVELEGDLDD